jgi:hypothetical protein
LGSFGYSAECLVSNHNANCFCPAGTTGDPFTSCVEITVPRKILNFDFLQLVFPFNVQQQLKLEISSKLL